MSRIAALHALAALTFGVLVPSCALEFTDYRLEESSTSASTASSSSTTTGAGGAGSFVDSECLDDMFATGVTPEGKLICTKIDVATVDAVNADCAVYAGWRPPTSTADLPTAWGKVSASDCLEGGGNVTCPLPRNLDGQSVRLLGLNTTLSIAEGDKLYYGFSCTPGSTAPNTATKTVPCGPGELLQGFDAESRTCVPARGAVTSFVNGRCKLYAGSNDDCYNECENAPERWGAVDSDECDLGVGPNTCITPMLDGVSVTLLGLAPRGIVDYTDKFYTGLDCTLPTAVESDALGACPEGQLIIAIKKDGTLRCASPAPQIEAAFAERCTLYSGWDAMLAMGDPTPANWGRALVGHCTPDLGDVSCKDFLLHSINVHLFGLNIVAGGQFFTGFACSAPPSSEAQ